MPLTKTPRKEFLLLYLEFIIKALKPLKDTDSPNIVFFDMICIDSHTHTFTLQYTHAHILPDLCFHLVLILFYVDRVVALKRISLA